MPCCRGPVENELNSIFEGSTAGVYLKKKNILPYYLEFLFYFFLLSHYFTGLFHVYFGFNLVFLWAS